MQIIIIIIQIIKLFVVQGVAWFYILPPGMFFNCQKNNAHTNEHRTFVNWFNFHGQTIIIFSPLLLPTVPDFTFATPTGGVRNINLSIRKLIEPLHSAVA